MIPGIAHVHSVSTVFDGRMLKYHLTPPAYQRQLRYWRELLLLYGLWKLKNRSSIFWYDTMRGSKSTWHASVWSPMLRYATPDDLVPPVYPTRVASTPCTRAILSSGVQNLQWEHAPSTPAAGILVSADTAPPKPVQHAMSTHHPTAKVMVSLSAVAGSSGCTLQGPSSRLLISPPIDSPNNVRDDASGLCGKWRRRGCGPRRRAADNNVCRARAIRRARRMCEHQLHGACTLYCIFAKTYNPSLMDHQQ